MFRHVALSVLAVSSVVVFTGDARSGVGTGLDPVFIRGDANNDLVVDNSDPIAILDYVFLGTFTPPCLAAADANDDGTVDGTDASVLLDYIWNNGPQPPAPFPSCGVDPSDDLTCDDHDCVN